MPLVLPSKISSNVLSTNSNTKYSFPFLYESYTLHLKTLNKCLPLECLLEHDYVLVLERPQHLNLSHRGFLHNFILICVFFEFLDSNYRKKSKVKEKGYRIHRFLYSWPCRLYRRHLHRRCQRSRTCSFMNIINKN